MISTTLTQLMGTPPVTARRRGPVAAAFRHDPCHATRPYAGIPTRRTATVNGNWVPASGFWVGSMVAALATIKRPTRHLAPRTT